MRGAAPLAVAALLGLAGAAAPDARLPGSAFMGVETRALQADDAANPASLWVLDGEALWEAPAGTAGVACAGCHAAGMAGVAARYPAPDPATGAVVDLATRVNLCRTRRQGAAALAPEGHDALALTAFLARASRGLPITPPGGPEMATAVADGDALFHARQGQLDLSCAQCHDDNWGRSLGGSPIPQAHPTGYPIYRLEWQSVGSLQRRLRGCLAGVRAEPYAYGARELVALEAYLMARAAGMAMDGPAVRP